MMQLARIGEIGYINPVVFMNTYGGLIGGVTLATTDLVEGELVPAATLFGIDPATGLAHIIKSAKVQAAVGNAVTAYPVYKGHGLKVGDIVALKVGGKASTITAITTTDPAFDTITVDLTLGISAAVGDGIMVAGATSTTTTSAAKFTPVGCTAVAIEIVKGDNNMVGTHIRADIYADRAPSYPQSLKDQVPQLMWVKGN